MFISFFLFGGNKFVPDGSASLTLALSVRSLSYQLVLKSKISQPIDLKFFILKGPHADSSACQIQPIIYHFEFSPNNLETEYMKLPINSQECNRMLSLSSISFRLLMVQLDRS